MTQKGPIGLKGEGGCKKTGRARNCVEQKGEESAKGTVAKEKNSKKKGRNA